MDKNRGGIAVRAGEVAVLMYDEPLAKAAILGATVGEAGRDVLYVDFDLMYSGHVAAGMLGRARRVEAVCPAGRVRETMATAISRASRGSCLVVIDSLNGMHRACAAHETMAVNSSLMMLASMARRSGASLVVACMARPDSAGWALVPMGRRVTALGADATWVWVHAGADGEACPEVLKGGMAGRPQTVL